MLRAALSRNPVYSAVALVAVLGSKTVAMPVIYSLIIHGLRASRLAQVGLFLRRASYWMSYRN